MDNKKNKVKGMLGTVLFHLLLFIVIIFFGLSTPLPLPGEEGVEVNLGSSDQGMGTIQEEEPAERIRETQPPPPTPEEEVREEDIITQDVEEAPAIQEEKVEKRKEKEEIIEDIQTQNEEVIEEVPEEEIPEPEPQKVDPRAMYKGKSDQNKGADEGITGQPGDQGKPNGDPNSRNYEGQGGAGNGIGFDLGGRGAKYLHKPSYSSEEQGRIKVEIKVNKLGKVVSASITKGTNITDQKLQKQALNAALKSTFEPDSKAPEVQKGTITYNFIRIN